MRKLKNSELNRITVEDFKQVKKSPIVVVLDDVRSLNNIGSVFRTCDGFLVEKIYLCGITAKPPHKDIYKTALGSTESVSWEYSYSVMDVIGQLKSTSHTIISVEQAYGATLLNDFKPNSNSKYALVFGNEVKGVSQEVVSNSDIVLEIPQLGTKHSLNIAVSAGIVIWDLFSKLRKQS